jgi:iron complex transport system substrate-binding protein
MRACEPLAASARRHVRRRVAPAPIAGVLLIVLSVAAAACSAGSTSEGTGRAGATPAVGAASTTPAPAFPFRLVGADGTAVTLTRAPERIVSLSPGMTETLFAIGAGGRVVGVDRFSDYPEAARALPRIEYTRPSVEAVVGLRPDLVLLAGRQKDAVAAMQAAGLPVVLLEEPATVQGVLERVRLIGRVTGQAAEAESLAAAMEARIRAVTEKLTGVERGPRVYHEISTQLHTVTPASFVGDLYTLLKARNIAEGAAGAFPQLSQEVIVQRDPEVIVLADGPGLTLDEVRARPGWGGISAMRTGRVHLLTEDQTSIVSRPGPRVVDALEFLAKLLYPERF